MGELAGGEPPRVDGPPEDPPIPDKGAKEEPSRDGILVVEGAGALVVGGAGAKDEASRDGILAVEGAGAAGVEPPPEIAPTRLKSAFLQLPLHFW